jgi:aromatic ring-cleaving dioxygenase
MKNPAGRLPGGVAVVLVLVRRASADPHLVEIIIGRSGDVRGHGASLCELAAEWKLALPFWHHHTHVKGMESPSDFHVHLYFDPHEVDLARSVAAEVAERFGASVGHFHQRSVGPHPRGSVQLTVSPHRFGEVACWLPQHRRGLTVFAHPSTGDDRLDHTDHVIWFGVSEPLANAMFD